MKKKTKSAVLAVPAASLLRERRAQRLDEGRPQAGAPGFRVKEMIGGIEAWKAEGDPVERGGKR